MTPPMDRDQLRVSDLHAFYGESHILHGVDLVVGRGELVTLLGRNGAGRTTTLRAIMNSPFMTAGSKPRSASTAAMAPSTLSGSALPAAALARAICQPPAR